MSQDSVNLAVLEATGDEKERARAGKVLGLLKKGQHWVLGTSAQSFFVVCHRGVAFECAADLGLSRFK